jgi:hypothetical protein
MSEHLLPEALDRLQLREEAMAAEVEAIAVELDCLRDAADGSVGLEDRSGLATQPEDVCGSQPGRAAAEDRRVDGFALFVRKPIVRFRPKLGAEATVGSPANCRQFSPPSLPDLLSSLTAISGIGYAPTGREMPCTSA